MERLEPESITSTIAEVRKAVAAAPDLGLAHALAARMIATTSARDGREPDDTLRREIHEYIRRAMQLEGNNPVILHYVVGAYINLRDGEAALRLARRAVELNPNSPRSRFALGQALYVSGQNAEAIAAFEKQLRLAPHDLNRPHALLHLGVCLCIEDRLDEAEAELDRSLALHPDNALALTIKSIAVALQGREEVARAVFMRMREIAFPYTFDEQLRLIALLLRERAEEAVAIFRRLWDSTEATM
jgi:tetratricopeptide (TPR) repeat protein